MAETIVHWCWEEAFSKFGFDDGDGLNMTDVVQEFLESLGWKVKAVTYGVHNYAIIEVQKDTMLLKFNGYINPRVALPKEVIDALNKEFEEESCFPSLTWWDLTTYRQKEFACVIKDMNFRGWEELKQAAWDFGFEPDEDMPTVYELRRLAESAQ